MLALQLVLWLDMCLITIISSIGTELDLSESKCLKSLVQSEWNQLHFIDHYCWLMPLPLKISSKWFKWSQLRLICLQDLFAIIDMDGSGGVIMVDAMYTPNEVTNCEGTYRPPHHFVSKTGRCFSECQKHDLGDGGKAKTGNTVAFYAVSAHARIIRAFQKHPKVFDHPCIGIHRCFGLEFKHPSSNHWQNDSGFPLQVLSTTPSSLLLYLVQHVEKLDSGVDGRWWQMMAMFPLILPDLWVFHMKRRNDKLMLPSLCGVAVVPRLWASASFKKRVLLWQLSRRFFFSVNCLSCSQAGHVMSLPGWLLGSKQPANQSRYIMIYTK